MSKSYFLIGGLAIALIIQMRLLPDAPIVPLSPGDSLPDLEVISSSSAGLEIFSRGSCLAMIVFSSTCPACQRVAPQYRRVRQVVIAGISIPVVWVGSEADAEAELFAKRHEFVTWAVLSAVSFDQDLRVDLVPMMYIFSAGGELIARDHPDQERLAKMTHTDSDFLSACKSSTGQPPSLPSGAST